MHIETLKYYIQSANINFLYGSGLSKPYLSTLGSIEKWLTELSEARQDNAADVKYAIVEASILKQYFEGVMLPNVNPSGAEYETTKAEYQRFAGLESTVHFCECYREDAKTFYQTEYRSV